MLFYFNDLKDNLKLDFPKPINFGQLKKTYMSFFEQTVFQFAIII